MAIEDAELDRKRPTSIRDYLKYSDQMRQMLVWVWRELINEEGKRLAKLTFVLAILVNILGAASPFLTGLFFNGLVAENLRLVVISLRICGG